MQGELRVLTQHTGLSPKGRATKKACERTRF